MQHSRTKWPCRKLMICWGFWNRRETAEASLTSAKPVRKLRYPGPACHPYFMGTKLERYAMECYMWITGDHPGCGTGERIGSDSGWSRGISFKEFPRGAQTMPGAGA